MLSFWEKQSLLHTDIAIIGGGITGLSVAASIKERWPDRGVVVFERSVLPYGASTRNAGFACFGSLTEVLADLDAMGAEGTRGLIRDRWEGIQITRKRFGDENIGFEAAGGYEWLTREHRSALDRIDEVNTLVRDIIPNYVSRSSSASTLGLHLPSGDELVEMKEEAQIHTGKLMRHLEQYVVEKGVSIRTGAQVVEIDRDNTTITVEDASRGRVDFRAEQIILCTNAFASKLTQSDVKPGRGQVFITEPIPGLQFRGNLHIDEGYYYLRSVDNRLLFGGGRNLDFEAENTLEFGLTPLVQKELELRLKTLFRFEKMPNIAARWSGVMGFGSDKIPDVRRVAPNLLHAIKLNGMGVALAGKIGEQVVDLLNE